MWQKGGAGRGGAVAIKVGGPTAGVNLDECWQRARVRCPGIAVARCGGFRWSASVPSTGGAGNPMKAGCLQSAPRIGGMSVVAGREPRLAPKVWEENRREAVSGSGGRPTGRPVDPLILEHFMAVFVRVSGLLRDWTIRADLPIAGIPYGHAKTALRLKRIRRSNRPSLRRKPESRVFRTDNGPGFQHAPVMTTVILHGANQS